jgi:hypothetical protein
VLAGLNQRRLGFTDRAKKDFLVSVFAFAGYFVYLLFFVSITPQHWPLPRFLGLLPVMIFSSPQALLVLLLPSVLLWSVLLLRQRSSWNALQGQHLFLAPCV